MRVTTKLIAAAILGIVAVLTVNAVARVRRELASFETRRRLDGHYLGRAVAGAAARIWAKVGEAQALDLVEDENERESEVDIRFVWLDALPGAPHAPTLSASALDPVRDGRELFLRDETRHATFTYVPVPLHGRQKAAIELRRSLDDEREYVRNAVVQSATTAALIALVISVLMSGLGIVLIGRPMQALSDKARRIGQGELTGDLTLPQRDEIGELGREMNRMAQRLADAQRTAAEEAAAKVQALEQLRHADRLNTVGKLASGIAHEIGTPLNVVIGTAQLVAERAPGNAEVKEGVRIIVQQAGRISAIVRQLLDFARRRPARKAPGDLRAIALETASMIDALARKQGVDVEVVGDHAVLAPIDAGQLQQALTNLVVNAIQAMPDGGTVKIEIARERAVPPPDVPRIAESYARVRVSDQGSGIPEDHVPHVFEPFFTTKPVGEGTGLGLSVAYGIVREHNGWIDVQSRVGAGSAFSIHLPMEPSA